MGLEFELINKYKGPPLATHKLYSPEWYEAYYLIHGFYHGSYYGDDLKPPAVKLGRRYKATVVNVKFRDDLITDESE